MVRLFYVDESRDADHHYHVGLLADGPAVHRAERSLDRLVANAFDRGVCRYRAEIHCTDMFHGNGDWSAGSIPDRSDALRKVLEVLADCNIGVIARGANLDRFVERYPGSDPYRWEFSNLLERLNERLSTLDDYGLVVADQQHQYRELLQHDLAQGKTIGTGGYRSQQLVRVLDTAHFVDSSLSRMVQLADVAAFVLRRRATIAREGDPRLEALMADLTGRIEVAIPAPFGQYHTIRS